MLWIGEGGPSEYSNLTLAVNKCSTLSFSYPHLIQIC